MNNKFFLLSLSLLLSVLLTSCQESFPSIVDEKVTKMPDEVVPTETEMDLSPIMPTLNAPQFNFVTRGTGPLDEWETDAEQWKNAKFHVFAFQTENVDILTQESLGACDMSQTSDYQDNGREGANNTSSLCLLYDRIMYVTDPAMGKVRFVENKSPYSGAVTDPEKSFYYRINGKNKKYNFFTFYADDAVKGGYRTNDEKTQLLCDVEIDGTQDIVHSFAYHKKADYLELVNKLAEQGLPADQMTVLTAKNEDGELMSYNQLLYSSYTGNRNINPVFNIHHLLSKFHVNVVGGKGKKLEEQEDYKKIIITDVEFVVPNRGTLTIADDAWGRPVGGADGTKDMGDRYMAVLDSGQLIQWDEASKTTLKGHLKTDDKTDPYYALIPTGSSNDKVIDFWKKDKTFRVKTENAEALLSQAILLPPSSEFRIKLKGYYLNTKTSDDAVTSSALQLDEASPLLYYEVESNVKLLSGSGFEPGMEYTINIYAYGYQSVAIEALFGAKWEEGNNGEPIVVNKDGEDEDL